MIENELLFLGLLMERPKHGYEIKRQIEEELAPHTGLKLKSIYYPLQKMEEAGLIGKEVGREGKWPEKYVYKITAKGKKRFNHLISHSFLSVERPFFQMDLSLYFLTYVDRPMARRRLKARVQLLRRIRSELAAMKDREVAAGKDLAFIFQHDLDLVDAEIISAVNLIAKI